VTFRTEIIGDQTLILGDCRDVMPTLGRFDACVTDPPWNMGYFDNDEKPWAEYADWLHEFNKIYAEISPNAAVVFLSSKAIPFVSHVFQGWQPFVACKNFSQMSKSKDTIPNAFDIGFIKIRGCFTGVGRNWFLCNTAGMLQERTGHPTPRTLDAMVSVMEWLTSFTILDPFMGSGTTLVACQQLGRKGTGIEISEKYFDIACKRVEQAAAQPRMFVEPVQKPKQEELL